MSQNLLDLEALVGALDSERKARKLSWRQLAKEAGVSPSTLIRMQQGKPPGRNTFTALTNWLRIPAERFYSGQTAAKKAEDPLAVISTLLRGKKKMSSKAMTALQELVNAAVKLSEELK
ncbi:MAG TPA: helix-turn-helix transcriptional regulator [Candidatus Angelobacter sp.]|nr:helix-turn-helix transcriptional regulator [Candidatus Angelobacter sp.]